MATMSITTVDKVGFRITHREITDEGYLRVPGRVAKTGIQEYMAGELGITDRKPTEIVRVYRPPEEVFADDSLSSYEDKDVTNDHPSSLVDAESFKKVSIGHVSSAGKRDGEYVVADLLIKDKAAIDAVQSGKAELSAGYMAEYIHEPGTTDAGEPYEFIQRGIKINHVALVDRARAGREARLFDHEHNGAPQMLKMTLDSGVSVEVADEATKQLLQKEFDGLRKQVQDAKAQAGEAAEKADKMEAEKDKAMEEKDEAEKKANDSAISERIKKIYEVRDAARTVAGEDFTCDSVDVMEIKRQALKAARPTIDWADKSDAYVTAAWDFQIDQPEEARAKQSHDGLASDISNLYTGDNGQMVGTSAYQEFLQGKGGK